MIINFKLKQPNPSIKVVDGIAFNIYFIIKK